MKKGILFLFLIWNLQAQTGFTSVWASNVYFFPAERARPQEDLIRAALIGRSEADYLSSLQQQYFYYVPAAEGFSPENAPGMYRVWTDSQRRLQVIERPGSQIRVIMRFSEDLRVQQKLLMNGKTLVDCVNYKWKGGRIIEVHSQIRGYKFFTPPQNIFAALWRRILKWSDEIL